MIFVSIVLLDARLLRLERRSGEKVHRALQERDRGAKGEERFGAVRCIARQELQLTRLSAGDRD